MRVFFIILSVLGIIIGLALTILPFGFMPLIPFLIAFVLSFLTLKTSEQKEKKFPRVLMILSFFIAIIAFGKAYFMNDEIAVDQQFEERIEQSNQENIEELEEIDIEFEELENDTENLDSLERLDEDIEEIENPEEKTPE